MIVSGKYIFEVLYSYPRMHIPSFERLDNDQNHFSLPPLVSCMIPEALAAISTMGMKLVPLSYCIFDRNH